MADDSDSQTTTDHETIRERAEDEELEENSWDEFFEEFEDGGPAPVSREDGRFSKLVDRDSA